MACRAQQFGIEQGMVHLLYPTDGATVLRMAFQAVRFGFMEA